MDHPGNHAFLFCDPQTGWPWTQELFNTHWHKIIRRPRAMAKEDPNHWTPWPKMVPYRNLRHHCATWWAEELDISWTMVAELLGNSYRTVLEHYVRTSEGDRAAARTALARLGTAI